MNIKFLLSVLAATLTANQALACASCGCSLNTDYGTQGMSNAGGWTLDLRYDYAHQNQLRAGAGTVSPTTAAATTNAVTGLPAEVEGFTKNTYLTASLDYNDGDQWGLTAHVPYVQRDHMTYGTDPFGSQAQGDYTSKTHGLGDVKLIARYFGWADERDWGIQFGIKLPTGRFDATDVTGATPVDPGLQLGTKTTDLIFGAYKFGQLAQTSDWGYFVNGQIQRATHSSNMPANLANLTPSAAGTTYRPGNALNLNLGINYHGWEQWTPTLQLNYIDKRADGGSAGDAWATGGKLLYLTPGAMVDLTEQTQLLVNVQLPVYQQVNGIQLAPKYIASVGLRIGF
jgi:hypothetical protein